MSQRTQSRPRDPGPPSHQPQHRDHRPTPPNHPRQCPHESSTRSCEAVLPRPSHSIPEGFHIPQHVPPPAGEQRSTQPKEVPEFEKKCLKMEAEHPSIKANNPAGSGWTEIFSAVTKHDKDMVEAHFDNINTLLVLAGLFSAVLTAFIIEAYKLLRRDSADVSVQLLMQISMQLTSLAINPGSINSTYVPSPLPSFSPDTSAVWINALWFGALVLSLVTSSLGMLVKQWLREYLENPQVSPQRYCVVRLFRLRGLRSYKVSEIASVLPLILQLALILFFAGLVLFILSIHQTIAIFITILITSWLLFVLGTSYAPLFSPSCPYKTPLLKSAFRLSRDLLNMLFKKAKVTSIGAHLPQRWKSHNELLVEEPVGSISPQDEADTLADFHKTFQDANSWDMIMRCIDFDDVDRSLNTLRELLFQIAGTSPLRARLERRELRALLKIMISCTRKAYLRASYRLGGHLLGHNDLPSLLDRVRRSFHRYNETDTALYEISELFLSNDVTWSTPTYPGRLDGFILQELGFSDGGLPDSIKPNTLTTVIQCTNTILDQSGNPSRRLSQSNSSDCTSSEQSVFIGYQLV
ncbi:hypothetical protein NLI96_g3417 [Meripilus lineatus]|uniref:DUF6535 domain-containing protein n=1 Tax=Meripilus lineatus TaxID=2056292 RepID=A0AAD5V6G6_9APHY|nr:hypothetical protein NLI96_g3417 [Physisporinus lineatus]